MATSRLLGHAPALTRAATGTWIERFARVGYAARGTVYGIIGVLALKLALGEGGRATDSSGAVAEVGAQPFGTFLLALLSLGLLAFVAWRLVQAFADTERKGKKLKGLLARAAYLVSAVAYGGLALAAMRQVVEGTRRGGGEHAKGWTARLLEQPFGQVLVGAVALIILGHALSQFWSAASGKFARKLSLSRVRPAARQWLLRISRFGLSGRAVIFLLIGFFLGRAATRSDPGEAKGMGETLRTLAQQPHGAVLLGVVALGLIAYAVYQGIQARYRAVPTA